MRACPLPGTPAVTLAVEALAAGRRSWLGLARVVIRAGTSSPGWTAATSATMAHVSRCGWRRHGRSPAWSRTNAGPVGDDRVDAELEAAVDVVGLVDGPDEDLVPALVLAADHLGVGAHDLDVEADGPHALGQRPVAVAHDRRAALLDEQDQRHLGAQLAHPLGRELGEGHDPHPRAVRAPASGPARTR